MNTPAGPAWSDARARAKRRRDALRQLRHLAWVRRQAAQPGGGELQRVAGDAREILACEEAEFRDADRQRRPIRLRPDGTPVRRWVRV